MKDKILEWCKTLSNSQGFYGRLLNHFEENLQSLDEISKNNFNDIVDFILFIES